MLVASVHPSAMTATEPSTAQPLELIAAVNTNLVPYCLPLTGFYLLATLDQTGEATNVDCLFLNAWKNSQQGVQKKLVLI